MGSVMTTSDKLLGGGTLAIAAFVFSYYTIWALFLPFLPSDSAAHNFFPDRVWAIRLPLILLLLGLSGIGAFFARVMFAEARKRAGEGKKV